jgi:uncharacterized protein (DUF2147 family)
VTSWIIILASLTVADSGSAHGSQLSAECPSLISDPPQSPRAPSGLWYAEGGAAEVQILPCSDALCGKVVWLRSPLDDDGCELRDDKNPNLHSRTRPILGLEVLRGLKPTADEDGVWAGGTIYDPASGRTYSCSARMQGEDRLFLRGYFGIKLLGRTTTWTRVGSERRRCQR